MQANVVMRVGISSRLGRGAVAALCCAAMYGCAAERGPAPRPHRVEPARPAPWGPAPVQAPAPARVVSNAPPAVVDDGLLRAPVGSAPRPRQTLPGETAIGGAQPGGDDEASTGSAMRPSVARAPRSELVPRPPEAPKALHRAWQADSAYNRRYNPAEDRRLAAMVEAVETFVPADGAEPGLALRVKVNGQERVVHAGPLRFLRDHGVRFNYQDELVIHASPVVLGDQTVLIARRITRGDTLAIDLRDLETGRPQWAAASSP